MIMNASIWIGLAGSAMLFAGCGSASAAADIPVSDDVCLPGPASPGDVCQSPPLEPDTAQPCDCDPVRLSDLMVGDGCSDEMVRVADYCIDRYEASVWDDRQCDGLGTQFGVGEVDNYPASWPVTGQYSDEADALYACSITGVRPSGWTTYFRAVAACAESGKRLCTNQQWQIAALGTPDSVDACPVGTGEAVETDSYATTCRSRWGVVGMVGNMQEWTADWVINGVAWYDGATQETAGAAAVPAEWPAFVGTDDRVRGVNGNAFAGVTPEFGFFNGLPSVLMRSGSYSQTTHAGALYLNANNSPVVAFRSGGFRCCATPWTLSGAWLR